MAVTAEGGGVRGSVEDNGRGFVVAERDHLPGHLGLLSLNERALLAGGWCKITSEPGKGTTVDSGSDPSVKQTPIRVLIVEDHQFVAEGLGALLNDQVDMRVVGNVGSVSESIALVPSSPRRRDTRLSAHRWDRG